MFLHFILFIDIPVSGGPLHLQSVSINSHTLHLCILPMWIESEWKFSEHKKQVDLSKLSLFLYFCPFCKYFFGPYFLYSQSQFGWSSLQLMHLWTKLIWVLTFLNCLLQNGQLSFSLIELSHSFSLSDLSFSFSA